MNSIRFSTEERALKRKYCQETGIPVRFLKQGSRDLSLRLQGGSLPSLTGGEGSAPYLSASKSTLTKALNFIEEGAFNKTQKLLAGIDMLRSLDLSNQYHLFDSLTRLVNLLSDPRTVSLSQTIMEKIVEVLPYALTAIIQKNPGSVQEKHLDDIVAKLRDCLLYTSPSPRDS